jgi:tRNA U34 2-thiouridine synthase MnmA/TrmU
VEIAGAIGSVGLADVTVHRKDIAGGTSAQLRSQGGATPAHMIDAHSLVLDEPVAGVALGQTAVLYHGDEVVLAGTIISTAPWADGGVSSS